MILFQWVTLLQILLPLVLFLVLLIVRLKLPPVKVSDSEFFVIYSLVIDVLCASIIDGGGQPWDIFHTSDWIEVYYFIVTESSILFHEELKSLDIYGAG